MAVLLVNLLTGVGDSIIIDYARTSIIDLAAKPSDQVVAGPERAGPFIAWLEQNQILAPVRLLKRPHSRI